MLGGWLIAVLAVPVMGITGITGIAGASGGAFRAAEPGYHFRFPRDHGAHPDFRTEWWYYTGNLTGAGGDEYGFQLTFFRSAIEPDMPARESGLATNQVYMGHFALTGLLLDVLKATPGARVVNVSSGAHTMGRSAQAHMKRASTPPAARAIASLPPVSGRIVSEP